MVLWLEDDRAAAKARQALRDLARRHLPGWSYHDREDLIQDAVLKALRQRRLPHEAPLVARARVTFWDELRDTQRRRVRLADREELREEMPTTSFEDDRSSAFLELADQCAALKELLGPKLVEFAILRARGFTYRQIAETDGWDQQRVDSARAQLRRKQSLMTTVFTEHKQQRKEAS